MKKSKSVLEEKIAERMELNPQKRKINETGLEILSSNKLLTRLPILLAQIKSGNNSYKLKNEIRQILYLLYQHNKITKKVYNNLIIIILIIIIMEQNMIVIRDPKTFGFNFDGSKYVDENLKHEIEFITKSNDSLAENKIKNEIEQLLSKYKHGNYIHEHRNSNTNEPHKFALNLSQRLDLRSSNKHVALQNLSICYTWKNIIKKYKNNKMIASR